METIHRPIVGDSRSMDEVADGAVELVVTSPPYPMIEMWDETFESMNPAIGEALRDGRGMAAFERMHGELAGTWREVKRVLADGGIACINVGDATRRLAGEFRLYPNHVAVTAWFVDNGFRPLPDVLWRKPTNTAAKFMGSGMLPPNAYVTLEHEYILVFRKGAPRSFEPGDERRYQSAYFWEERNEWFSDVWTDVTGRLQAVDGDGRDRSGAFPFAIPFRLINMYSTYGDTVLDPFWGTGTTTIAAMVAGRDSIGYEFDGAVARAIDDRLDAVPDLSRRVQSGRLDRHRKFVREREMADDPIGHASERYGVPVVTSQEEAIRFYVVDGVDRSGDAYVARHTPLDASTGE